MRCVGRRGGVKEIHGGGMKKARRWFQEEGNTQGDALEQYWGE